jgi:acetylglutamate kinase
VNLRVVKIGGAALADAVWLSDFAAHAAQSKGALVVVHGGGPDINEMSTRLGLDYTWSNGRRVTTPELMDVVGMVLTGRVNKRIVSALVGAGVDALGVSGLDAAILQANLAEDGALGRVGQVRAVRTDLIEWMTANGVVPVLSPVSRGPDGESVNVNADEAACAVAAALGAAELLFLTDVDGVRGERAVLSSLSVPEAKALIDARTATGGMALKLTAAMEALRLGVACVRIGRFETLVDAEAGTTIRPETEVATCR